MKRIRTFLGVALALGGLVPLAVVHAQAGATAQGATAGQSAAGGTASEDDPDNIDGQDPEGGTVVDPVPQDDGSDGVDDGSGDDSQ